MACRIHGLGTSALELRLHGRPAPDGRDQLSPQLEERFERHSKLGLLVEISEPCEWTPDTLWGELHLAPERCRGIARLALVADDPHQERIAMLSKPFVAAEVRFYASNDLTAARIWVSDQRGAADR